MSTGEIRPGSPVGWNGPGCNTVCAPRATALFARAAEKDFSLEHGLVYDLLIEMLPKILGESEDSLCTVSSKNARSAQGNRGSQMLYLETVCPVVCSRVPADYRDLE